MDSWSSSPCSSHDGYHPIQERIAQYNGSQCGFCTPGMVMNMYRLVHDDDVIDHMINDVIIDYIVSLRSHPLLLNNKLKIPLMGTSADVQVICLYIVSVL